LRSWAGADAHGSQLPTWRRYRLPGGDDTSQRSSAFFERFGFETRFVTPAGYGPGLDRHEMELRLTNHPAAVR
jgi:hypothetical protein